MIKRKFLIILLLVVLGVTLTGCNLEEFMEDPEGAIQEGFDQLEDWWGTTSDDLEEWWGTTSDEIDDWWIDASIELEDWWGQAKVDLSDWWDETKATGEALYVEVQQRINKCIDELEAKKDKFIDNIVTNAATGIYNNSNASFQGTINHNKQFEEVTNLSTDVSYYDYDESSFIYKLVYTLFPTEYDVFPAIVVNSNNEAIVGIGYCDFTEKYSSNDKTYYSAGFISCAGELTLTKTDLNSALEIYRADGYNNEKESFVLSYMPESFETHCVSLGKYFIFGVDDQGQIYYEATDYNIFVTKEEYGELYSFDENKIIKYHGKTSYLTDSPFMVNVNLSNRTVEDIKAEIYEYLNGFKIDTTKVSIKKIFENVKTLGKRIFEKNKIKNEISKLTIDDLCGTEVFSKHVPVEATLKEKWVVGSACVVAVISTVMINVIVSKSAPAVAAGLTVLLGGVTGVAVETFIETVIQNNSVKSLDYRKLGLSAIAGAISSKMGILGDSIIGGFTDGAFSLIDGKNFEEIIESVVSGVIIGVTLGTVLDAVSKLFSGVGNKISNKINAKKASNIGDDILVNGKKVNYETVGADDKSIYIAKKVTVNSLDDGSTIITQYQKKCLAYLPATSNKSYRYLDINGNPIDYKTLNGYIEVTDQAPASVRNALVSKNGVPITRLKINNGTLNFEEISLATARVQKLSRWRTVNFSNGDKILADSWSLNSDQIPSKCKKYLDNIGVSPEDISPVIIEKLRMDLSLTWHESAEGVLYLVPNAVHNVSLGGIGHIGAISTINLLRQYGNDYNTIYAYVRKVS